MFFNVKPVCEASADFPPENSCEFAGKPLYIGAKGRKCKLDDGSCFHFDKSGIYPSCPTRMEKPMRLIQSW